MLFGAAGIVEWIFLRTHPSNSQANQETDDVWKMYVVNVMMYSKTKYIRSLPKGCLESLCRNIK